MTRTTDPHVALGPRYRDTPNSTDCRLVTIVDLLTSPWAILPEQLLELQAIYATHVRGEKIDIAAIEARLGRPLANEQKAYRIEPGTNVAVLEIAGVIAPKANLFTQISGGAAASLLQQQVQSMLDDGNVGAVVLDVDSPGGQVFGIPALAQAVRALADAKPTVAVSTGLMCSAAYWIACGANAVLMSGATDHLGSIGVVATHNYVPNTRGTTTEITAGRYKRIASESQPLTPEGRAHLQERVDAIYSAFVQTVADYRGAAVDAVLERMADGRMFVGQQAIDAGLADGYATVDQAVEQLASAPGHYAKRRRAVFALDTSAREVAPAPAASAGAGEPIRAAEPGATIHGDGSGEPLPPISRAPAPGVASLTTGDVTMTPEERAAAFAAEHAAAAAVLRSEGAAGERARIQSVRAQSMPGHEALVEQLAFDGRTTGPEAAAAVVAAERARLGAIATARANDAPAPVPQAPAPEAEDKPVAADNATVQAEAAALAERVVARQREAAKNGRTLSVVEALALVNKEQ